jgi:hypothetical protein
VSGENDWGFGNGEEKPFDASVMDDGTPFTLHFGEHPHSRSDDRIYAKFENGTVEAFDGHRILTRVELRTFNYLKMSGLSGNEVRKGGQFRIWLNGKLVWAEFVRDGIRGLQKTASTLGKLLDCSMQIWRPDEPEKGRKIYYRETPAIIESFDCDEHESSGNRMVVRAECGQFPRAPWDEDGEYVDETAVVDTLSPHIWWWRK